MNICSSPADKIIVALDGMERDEAISFASKLPGLRWVKVGLELFLKGGPQIVFDLREQGLCVFLDLKFHDIPITMARACRSAATLGAELITVHACAGKEALCAAQIAAADGALESGFSPPTLLAVTVLTSWDVQRMSKELFINQTMIERVEGLAKLAYEAGIGGLVCSPEETSHLRKIYPMSCEIVTPGIRFKGDSNDDQSRVMSPKEAIQAGATRLVVGRSITRAVDQADAFSQCCLQLA